jgi:hypothetical protein
VGAQQISENEKTDHREQRRLAWKAHRRDCDNRRAGDHAERVPRDEQTGAGNRNAQIACHVGQEAHDHEFRRADAERGDRQRQQGQRNSGERRTRSGQGRSFPIITSVDFTMTVTVSPSLISRCSTEARVIVAVAADGSRATWTSAMIVPNLTPVTRPVN